MVPYSQRQILDSQPQQTGCRYLRTIGKMETETYEGPDWEERAVGMRYPAPQQVEAAPVKRPLNTVTPFTQALEQGFPGCRPNEPLSAEADALKVEEVQQQSRQGLRDAAVLDVFLEVGGPKGFQAITPAHIMVFLKAYNPASSELRVRGCILQHPPLGALHIADAAGGLLRQSSRLCRLVSLAKPIQLPADARTRVPRRELAGVC